MSRRPKLATWHGVSLLCGLESINWVDHLRAWETKWRLVRSWTRWLELVVRSSEMLRILQTSSEILDKIKSSSALLDLSRSRSRSRFHSPNSSGRSLRISLRLGWVSRLVASSLLISILTQWEFHERAKFGLIDGRCQKRTNWTSIWFVCLTWIEDSLSNKRDPDWISRKENRHQFSFKDEDTLACNLIKYQHANSHITSLHVSLDSWSTGSQIETAFSINPTYDDFHWWAWTLVSLSCSQTIIRRVSRKDKKEKANSSRPLQISLVAVECDMNSQCFREAI